MKISAIIPTRGRYDSLCRTLKSIRLQNYHHEIEIIVIDDASNPPLPADLPYDTKVFKFINSVGACKARNAGVQIAQGELLLFMDDDAELIAPDDLARAVNWFQNRPNLGAVGFRQLTPDREVHFMQPVAAAEPVRTGLFFSYACMIRRDAFEKAGGMNEEFGYYQEEVELSLKLFSQGYEIIYDPTLMAIHHQDNRHRDWQQIYLISTRNLFLSYLIHYPVWLIIPLFLKRLVFHARLTGRLILSFADLNWLTKELVSKQKYIQENRQPLTWAVIRKFHQLCGKSESLKPG